MIRLSKTHFSLVEKWRKRDEGLWREAHEWEVARRKIHFRSSEDPLQFTKETNIYDNI